MARKNTMKNDNSSITFDTKNKSVMADVAQDNIKEKVNAVREVVQGRSNNEIILVLQYYDYDVEKAIQAYVDDGAKLALREWRYTGTKPVKKKKNKKKPAAEQKVPLSPESASSESGSAACFMVNGDVKEPVVNGILENHIDTDILKTNNKLLPNGPTSVSPVTIETPSVKDTTVAPSNGIDRVIHGPPEVKIAFESEGAKEKSPSPQPQRQLHVHHVKQRTHSGSHSSHHDSRNRTASTSSVGDGKSGKKPAHHGLERSSKDLHRQTVSLERLRLIFNEEVDKTYKRIKSVFDELRNCLVAREAQLVSEMNCVRDTGTDMFSMRQGLAADLKVKIDRAERMNETELAELRNEIKHFVSERKMDEDMARNTRFFYDSDLLTRSIQAFGDVGNDQERSNRGLGIALSHTNPLLLSETTKNGETEVMPVKCTYSQRRGSVSSAVSDDHPLPGQVLSSNHATGEKKESIRQSSPLKGERPDNASIAQPSPSTEEDKKESQSHLAPSEAHEVAELQKRLKHSLTLEGIPVVTYQDRPESAPPTATTSNTTTETNAASQNKAPRDNFRRNNNRNRRQPDNRDRRDRGPRDDNRVSSFTQNSSGERIILIGRNTRPQSGPPRPRGGGRGRGGYGGRGRDGNSNPGPRSNQDSNPSEATPGSSSGSQEKNPSTDRPRREGSGSPRKGRGGGGYRGSGSRGRGSPPNRSSAPDTVNN